MPAPTHASSLGTHTIERGAMLPTIPVPEDYEVSPYTGFLPSEPPLKVLPDRYYAKWESVATNLQALLLSRRLRGVVDSLPVLSTAYLQTPSEWRRAYTILSFISHAYIWGGDRPAEVVPPSISVPYLSTCAYFELPSVATYAGVTLWNFNPLFDDEPIDNLENLSTLLTFTGSLDESWFYLVSVAIEARGAPVVPIMLDAIDAARRDDVVRVTMNLESFAERLDDLGTLLQRMYENCDPHVFYHRIRPFLAGSKNMAEAGLPNGVTFDNGTGLSRPVKFSGGSNAQSSLIQFFDIVLGIEHRPTGQSPTSSASESEGPAPSLASSQTFITEMRRYMPGGHRRFLSRVAEVANIRDYVEARRKNKNLAVAYDACLAMLRAFRDKHIRMVSRYVIVKARESRSDSRSLSPRQAPFPQRINLASASQNGHTATAHNARKLKGTGGTALLPFLKQARDETGEPAIGNWARRLLTNAPVNGEAPLGTVDEHGDGKVEIVGLAGIWSVDDSEGGICHW